MVRDAGTARARELGMQRLIEIRKVQGLVAQALVNRSGKLQLQADINPFTLGDPSLVGVIACGLARSLRDIALHVPVFAGDDIDHTEERVGAVKTRTGAANHFY